MAAIGLGVAFVSFLAARRVTLVSQEPRATGFVASLEVTGFRPDGTVGYTQHYLHAVRPDGSWADLERLQDPEGHWKERKILCDLAERRRVTVDGLTDSLTTYPLSPGSIASLKGMMSSCAAGTPSAQGNILGYGVVKVVRDLPLSAQQVSHEESWVAPALGCYELSATSTLGPPSGPAAKVVVEVVAVAEGSPPRPGSPSPRTSSSGPPLRSSLSTADAFRARRELLLKRPRSSTGLTNPPRRTGGSSAESCRLAQKVCTARAASPTHSGFPPPSSRGQACAGITGARNCAGYLMRRRDGL